MQNNKKLLQFYDTLVDAYDFIFNDTILTIGEFAFNLFTICATLYYAITNNLAIIPQWGWGLICVFMLIVGTYTLKNLIEPNVTADDVDDDIDDTWEDL